MKKLSLKKLKLEASDLLQRNELKTVFGGYYSDQILEFCESSMCHPSSVCSTSYSDPYSGETGICQEFLSSCNGASPVAVTRCVIGGVPV
jgi:hypothetical protein